MSETPEPPTPVYRLKAKPGATAQPVRAPEPAAAPIDVQEFVRAAGPAPGLKFAAPPRPGLDDDEKGKLRGLCVGALLGIFLVGHHFLAIRTALAARTWPVTTGIVESNEILTHVTENGDGDREVTYEPIIKYRFKVEGTDYVSTRVDLRDPTKHEWMTAVQVTYDYRRGAKVTVHYDPQHPDLALLDPAITGENWAELILGLILMLGGTVAAVALWRDWRSPG